MRINSPRSAAPVEQPVSLDGTTAEARRDRPARRRTDVTRTALIRGGIVMAAVVAILVAAYFIPLPSIATARAWSESLGPWFPALFFLAYAVVPIGPVPRTAFTVTAGVLFAPALAFAGATVSSTIAAVAAFLLARRLGRERIRPYLRHPVIATVEYRLERRGWLAVGSLRLIAVCPFSLLNYLSGLSSIRLLPYTAATVIGMTPGNAALIFLGNALTGEGSPISLVFSAVLFSIGVIGLIVDTRMPVNGSQSSKNT
ncbi:MULTISPECIES: TVP38/TMEM64 family protein [Gordonia]|uniref:TVP38/TMEM64 family membrane protein n=2 Tax=Gordonia TaxID=2053 RepID=L7LFH3_9ACTN|nr:MULTISPECIES: TVP38/TMEM64 family protein [Gordonia]AUH69042.1 TVP38/TMEM64 family protein [Gordonia sp. YC-JH1]KJR05122.1 membrane protein [Gordonia sihwensis]KXT56810.1 membrane protein [Gordonia sp. QH-12]MBY4568582.1 TVP38/TMEM64 family protein [Gordonia sihwensis]GAC59644.1 hypothetical protein GSI01S_03_01040 [Gordonia sihwensis NBRC 108236]